MENVERTEEIKKLSFMQCGGCAAPLIASVLATIEDVAVIIHSPAGCAASFNDFNRKYKNGLKKRGLPPRNARLINTNLTECDVVLGIDDKLEAAVDEAVKRFKPKAVFIAASCGSGVTGMEVQEVIDRIQKRFSIPLVTIVCEIYGPKRWGSGFDGKRHGVLKKIVKPVIRQENFYNIVDFSGDDTMKELLAETGIHWNYVSCYAGYESLENMACAKGTFQLCPSRFDTYIATRLASEFDVPHIKVPLPYGLKGTELCLKMMGKAAGSEEAFEKVIWQQEKRYSAMLAVLKQKLKGIRCLPIIMNDAYERSILNMLKELDIHVLWDDGEGEMEYKALTGPKKKANRIYGHEGLRIAFNQGYRLLNLIKSLKPDILIVKHNGLGSLGVNLGIPTFWMEEEPVFYGYSGLVRFGQKIADTISNPGFFNRLAEHTKLPYTQWWMDQELFWEEQAYEEKRINE